MNAALNTQDRGIWVRKTIRQVMHPQRTIERCADAMFETLKGERERLEQAVGEIQVLRGMRGAVQLSLIRSSLDHPTLDRGVGC